jgi:hypothetical protein
MQGKSREDGSVHTTIATVSSQLLSMPSMRTSDRADMNLAVASAEGMVEMGRGPWGWMVSSEEPEERKRRRLEIQAMDGNDDQRHVASHKVGGGMEISTFMVVHCL